MALTGYTLPAASSWKFSDNIIGAADIAGVYTAGTIGAPGVTPLPSTVIEQQLFQVVKGQSYDATYGGTAQFIFLAIPTSTATTQGLLYTYKGDGTVVVVATTVSSSAQAGMPLVLCLNSVTSNATSLQYAWFMVQGRGAALKGATLNAQPSVSLQVSGVTAGRVRTTASLYRSIIGIRSGNTATATGSILPVVLQFPSIGPGI